MGKGTNITIVFIIITTLPEWKGSRLLSHHPAVIQPALDVPICITEMESPPECYKDSIHSNTIPFTEACLPGSKHRIRSQMCPHHPPELDKSLVFPQKLNFFLN